MAKRNLIDIVVSNNGEMISRTCSSCGVHKKSVLFHTDNGKKYGKMTICTDCVKRYRNLKSTRIRGAIHGAKRRCSTEKSYINKGIQCFLNVEDVSYLWDRDKVDDMERPSLDRINNYGHYTRDNCQFIELSENILKDRLKPVAQKSKDGIIIAKYPSYKDAHLKTGIYQNGICRAANGILKSAGGYLWENIDEH